MKLIKLFSVTATAVILAACSTVKNEPVSSVPAVKSEKVVAYSCNKKPVRIAYQFEGQKAVSANVTLGKLNLVLPAGSENADFTIFENGKYRLNLDTDFTPERAEQVDIVTFVQVGKKSDKILAKNCSIKPVK